MYGADPLELLSWRFPSRRAGTACPRPAQPRAGSGATAAGPDRARVGATETFIPERPLPGAGSAGHYGRGAVGDPTGPVTNEDYAALLCEFAGRARQLRGEPGDRRPGEPDGLRGVRHAWARRLELRATQRAAALPRHRRTPQSGYTTVLGGDRFPYHGRFVPGNANAIGFEDLVVIEDYEFCRAVAERPPVLAGLRDAPWMW